MQDLLIWLKSRSISLRRTKETAQTSTASVLKKKPKENIITTVPLMLTSKKLQMVLKPNVKYIRLLRKLFNLVYQEVLLKVIRPNEINGEVRFIGLKLL